jgi:Xaa-Pro aminopeptidase
MSGRAQRVIGLLGDAGVDALLLTNLVNVRYLTGYTGSNGLALIGFGVCAFVTDFRYVEQAAQEVDAAFDRRRGERDLLEAVEEALPNGPLRLGFEEAYMSVRQHRRLRELLPDRIELVGVHGLVERLRATKEPDEVAAMRRAAAIADEALVWLLGNGLIGRTERELALELEQRMRLLGAEDASFTAIVAGGPHGALPHASPRDVEVVRGELVVIDWGARVDGYNSDCTRTVAAGAPDGEAESVYELVLQAQLAGVSAVRAGASGRDVDSAARSVIDAAGHGPEFGHGLGHGVGLEVHEDPRLSQRSDDVLSAGNAVTVEPGVYLPGRFGVRIEDLVIVTQDGCDILSSVSKELIVAE